MSKIEPTNTDRLTFKIAPRLNGHEPMFESLRTSEIRYRRLFEAARDGILILDAVTLKITDVNPFMTELLGYRSDEFLGKELWQLGFFTDKKASKLAFSELQKTGYLRYDDLPLKTINGELRDVEFVSNVYDEDDHKVIQCNIRDITARKQSEERESVLERRYHTLFEYAPDGIVVASPESYYLDANESMCRMLGYDHGELIGMHASDVVTAPEIKHIESEFSKIQDTSDYHREWQFRRNDGSEFPGEVIATIMPDGNLLAMIRDITESKRVADGLRESESLLKASEAELRALFAAMNDVIFVLGADGYFREIAPSDPTFLYKPAHELIGKTLHEVFTTEQADFFLKHIHQALDGGRLHIVEYSLPINGVEVWFDGRVSPITEDSVIWVARDITDRKRAETEQNVISEIIQGAAKLTNLDEFLKLVHRSLGQIVYAENCFVMLHDPVTDLCQMEYWIDKHDTPPSPQLAGKGYSNHILRTGKPLLLTEELKKHLIETGEVMLIGSSSASWLGVPLRTRSRTIGAMVVQHYEEQGAFTQRDLEFLSSVGDQIALAIERKRVEDELRESESLLAASQRIAHLGSWVMDLSELEDGKLHKERWSDEHYRIYGFEPGEVEISDEVFYNSVHPDDRERLAKIVRQSIEQQEPFTIEHRIILPDGRERIVRAMGELVLDNKTGKPLKLLGSVQDITERKLTQAALIESEQRYRSVVETAPDVIVTIDESSTILFVNPAAERVFGYGHEEMKGASLTMLMPEYLRHLHKTGLEHYHATGIKHVAWEYVELTGLHKSGREIPITISFSEYVQHDRRYFTGIIRDISERKQAMERLRESEERYRELVENALDIIYTQDLKGNYTSINKAGESITGFTREESLRRNLRQAVAPEYRKKANEMIAAQLEGLEEPAYELEIIAKDGHRVAVEVNTRIMYENGSPVGVQGIARDISARKAVEAGRLASERKYQALFTLAPVGIYQSQPDGSVTTANAAFAHMLGYDSVDELLGKNFADIYFDPDERGELLNEYEGRGFVADMDLRWKRKDGSPVWVQLTAHAIKGPEAETEYFEGFVRDITESKRAEKEIELTMQRLNDAQRIGKIGDWKWDMTTGSITWSREVFEIIGRDPALGPPGNYEEMISSYEPASRELLAAKVAAAMESGKAQEYEVVAVRPKGEQVFIHAVAEPQKDQDGRVFALGGTIQDITDRKHLEEELRQSQKMEAVGALAGGIAHDFNNLLTAINGYSDLTLRKMSEDDPLRGNIREIRDAGDRAAELTSQLLAFSRKQVLKPRVYNLNAAISEIDKMLRRIMRESIELRTVLAPDLGNIKADPGQIEQVIMNLAVNARDAMPKGGTLTIETTNVHLDEEYVSQHISISPGDFVKLTVTDTGAGMDEATRERIFEPFFTTKDVGKGTGLGLSTVHGIVKQSGGDIMVYSEIGHGTTFKIYLPCIDEPVDKVMWVSDATDKYTGAETILLVEDEEIVRKLICEVLTDNGYNVLEAASGKAALSVCETYSEPIHMLLTDVVMPKMSGDELRDVVVKSFPHIKVLFMSGYTDDAITFRGILDPDTEFIEKPFTPDDLSKKVREVFEH